MKDKIYSKKVVFDFTTKEEYFQYLLEILSSFNPIKLLSNKEKDLLVILLVENDNYKNLSPIDKSIIILSENKRSSICDKLGCDRQVLSNLLLSLKKKGILLKDGFLAESLNLYYYEELSISFILKSKQ